MFILKSEPRDGSLSEVIVLCFPSLNYIFETFIIQCVCLEPWAHIILNTAGNWRCKFMVHCVTDSQEPGGTERLGNLSKDTQQVGDVSHSECLLDEAS